MTAVPHRRSGQIGVVRGLINDGCPFRRDQAAALGINRKQLTAAAQGGRLRRPFLGVYVDAAMPDSRKQRLDCLRLVLPSHGVVCLRSAAWVWKVNAFGPDEQDLLVPEYVVEHHRGRMRQSAVRVREATFGPEDVIEIDGIRVTTERRPAMDLARRLRRPMALAALDAFTHRGLVTVEQLRADLDGVYRFPGVKQARELIALTEPLTESPGESWLRLRVIDAGFPRPEPQISICDRGGREVSRIDLGYRERRLGLEYDGLVYHDDPEARRHDEMRRARLRSRFGWEVHGFDRGHVLGRKPTLELVVGDLLGVAPRLPRRW